MYTKTGPVISENRHLQTPQRMTTELALLILVCFTHWQKITF